MPSKMPVPGSPKLLDCFNILAALDFEPSYSPRLQASRRTWAEVLQVVWYAAGKRFPPWRRQPWTARSLKPSEAAKGLCWA